MKLNSKTYAIIYFILIVSGVFIILSSTEWTRFYISENYTYDPLVFEIYATKLMYIGFTSLISGIIGLFLERYKR